MLPERFNEDLPLPCVGSFGFLRGTGQRARVLRRNPAEAGEERRCLVKLYQRIGGQWFEVLGSTGNTTVEERDLFPNEKAAWHCGRPTPRPSKRRRRAR